MTGAGTPADLGRASAGSAVPGTLDEGRVRLGYSATLSESAVIGAYGRRMRTLKNPMFMTSALFLIAGVLGLALNAMTGVILLVIGLFTSIAGCLVNARRGSSRADTRTDTIRLRTPR
jgi:hypothetical protein